MENKKKIQLKKCTSREYHMQHNKDVEHHDVKMYCAKNQFPELNFLGPHNKSHGVRGLVKHYNMRVYPQLDHFTYEIHLIPCYFTSCTYSLYQTWITFLPAHQQPCYQPIKDCTYLHVFGSFKNWKIIKLSHKATCSEDMD